MDLKSREIYEAPGAHIILAVHKDLESATLTKQQLKFKKTVDDQWGTLVYHGEWYQPLKSDLDAFVDSTQETVSGTWTIQLYKGNIDILKRDSAASLFRPEIRSIASTGFNQQLCGPAAIIRGLPFEVLALRDESMKTAQTNGAGSNGSAS
jgi:argininosuccinate synthase